MDTQGLNTGCLDNEGDQCRTDLEIGEECRFGEDGGSMEFEWRRGVQGKGRIRTKGLQKEECQDGNGTG